MASHEAICPACGSTLLVHVFAHVGGTVEEAVGVSLAMSAEEQTAQAFLAAKEAAEARVKQAVDEANAAARAVLAAEEARAANLAAASKVSASKVKAAKAVVGGE